MKPCFILVRPQMAENIGTAARAMMNCCIDEMRLVEPDYSPTCERAIATSSGAEEILYNAKVFNSVKDAIIDLQKVYATTGRTRDQVKPVFTGEGMAKDIAVQSKNNIKCGVMFGPERTGLENRDMDYADVIVRIPLNPKHTSLNLAQAVLLTGYEIFRLTDTTSETGMYTANQEMASKAELDHLFNKLENDLEANNYFKVPEKKPRMIRNLQNIFLRANLTSQDVRTLHGVFDYLNNKQ